MLETWLNFYAAQSNSLNLVFENSLLGTLTTDGRQIYIIDDLAVPAPPDLVQQRQSRQHQVPEAIKPLIKHNTLHAYELASGKNLWRLDNRWNARREFKDSRFLGAPLPVGGKLYALNERDNGELRLACIDPVMGQVVLPLWKLGTLSSPPGAQRDLVRRVHAVHLACADGVLVCPTHAGAVIGVDLVTGDLLWAFTYGDGKVAAPRIGEALPDLGKCWKACAPILSDGKVVFTAPDDESIYCLDLQDGTLLWKAGRTEDVYLAGVDAGKVLLVGKAACRALDSANGREVWKVASGLPSGFGVAVGDLYYLPVRAAATTGQPGLCVLDVRRGEVVVHLPSRKEDVPGNLLFHAGQVLSQTATGITAYAQVKGAR
jgi:outer membrane protein assembly factor BamB